MVCLLLLFCICCFNIVQCQKRGDLVHTPDRYLYKDVSDLDLSIDLVQSVVFYVRACNDVHIGLFKLRPSPKIKRFYEIVIGGWRNTRSVIRDTRQGNANAEYNGTLLNCNVYRKFWISWQGQRLKVGRGKEINKNIIMEHSMRIKFKVQYVAITTGYGSEGKWLFEEGKFDCQNVSCDSNQFKRNICQVEDAETIRSVTVVSRRSMSECQLGQSFGITGNSSIFVDNGCRATFNVCFLVHSTDEDTVTPTESTVSQGDRTSPQKIDPQDPSTAPQVALVEQDLQTIIPVAVVIVVVLFIVIAVVTIVTKYRHNRKLKTMNSGLNPDTNGYDDIKPGNEMHGYVPLAVSGLNSSVKSNTLENIYDEIEIKKSKKFKNGQFKNPVWKNNHVKNKFQNASIVKPRPRYSIYDQDEYAVVK